MAHGDICVAPFFFVRITIWFLYRLQWDFFDDDGFIDGETFVDSRFSS